jgi:hypothetical protein
MKFDNVTREFEETTLASTDELSLKVTQTIERALDIVF